MRALLLLALVATGCATDAYGEAAATDDAVEIPRSDLRAGSASDLFYGARALGEREAHVAALSAQDQAALAAAHRLLVENCPYRRGAVQLVVTLRASMTESFALARDPAFAEGAPALARSLRALDAATAAHVSLLTTLGVAALEAPPAGSYLYGEVEAAPLDAVASATATLLSVQDLVDAMDGATKQALDDATAQADALAGFRLEQTSEVISYNNALRWLAEDAAHAAPDGAATDGALATIRDAARVAAALTGSLMGLNC